MIKGFGDQDPDIESFLRPDGAAGTDPWKADGHSTVGYDAKFQDSDGFARGTLGFTEDDPSFRSPSWTGDRDDVNANHGYLIDNDPSLPSNKLIAGGGALSQKGGIGAGPRVMPRRMSDIADRRTVSLVAAVIALVVANAGKKEGPSHRHGRGAIALPQPGRSIYRRQG
jgi:hypothetical protein